MVEVEEAKKTGSVWGCHVDKSDGVRDRNREAEMDRWPHRKTGAVQGVCGRQSGVCGEFVTVSEGQIPIKRYEIRHRRRVSPQRKSLWIKLDLLLMKPLNPPLSLSLAVCVCVSVSMSDVVLWCYCGLSLTLSQTKKLCSWCYTVFIVAFFRSSTQCPHTHTHTHVCTHTRTLTWISSVWEAEGTSLQPLACRQPKAIPGSFWQ